MELIVCAYYQIKFHLDIIKDENLKLYSIKENVVLNSFHYLVNLLLSLSHLEKLNVNLISNMNI